MGQNALNVLIADDNKDHTELLESCIKKVGFNPLPFPNINAGLYYLRKIQSEEGQFPIAYFISINPHDDEEIDEYFPLVKEPNALYFLINIDTGKYEQFKEKGAKVILKEFDEISRILEGIADSYL